VILHFAKLQIPSKMLLFADDVVIYQRETNLTNTTSALGLSVYRFNESINELHLQRSPHKCKSVLFTLRPFNPSSARILFGNNYFTALAAYKYLGITLDSKLTWKKYILITRDRAFAASNVLKSLFANHWGGNPATLLLFYK